ncbi:hypothetical protein GCT13_45965 [Paraburkholderia sp. CNPSo 3157]|uniref:Uncharacterized protein n=1 Tax=Paraburkholderia franconis TaxID=2654983 RepID=A0A7X1NKT3_9BURK|nr:hypothetical protein [Paraburkholderia franconis]MPW23837.1 hypothetical protein [Paraburkholderia franconis]
MAAPRDSQRAPRQFNVTAIAIDELKSAPPTLILSNVFIVNNNGFGVNMVDTGLYSIVGNNFSLRTHFPVSVTGVDILSSTSVGAVCGDSFYKMSRVAAYLGAASTGRQRAVERLLHSGVNVSKNGTGNTVGGDSQ